MVFNYGAQLVYRSQQSSFADDLCAADANNAIAGQCNAGATVPEQLPTLRQINAYTLQPSLWAKLYYRALAVEFEGTGMFGRMDHGGILLAPGEGEEAVTFRQFGWVLASELRLYRDTLFVGLEAGGASGDQAEDAGQYLNYRWRFVRQPAGDHSVRDFHFSPEYHID